MNELALLLAATLNAGTALALAGLGLLINERSGIINLGGYLLTVFAPLFAQATFARSLVLFVAGHYRYFFADGSHRLYIHLNRVDRLF